MFYFLGSRLRCLDISCNSIGADGLGHLVSVLPCTLVYLNVSSSVKTNVTVVIGRLVDYLNKVCKNVVSKNGY